MKMQWIWVLIGLLFFSQSGIEAQVSLVESAENNSTGLITEADSLNFYQSVKTYLNPILPGDHPDPTLIRVGNDFYHCGSSFHFTPYLPIYHSEDLIHWEVISRVVPPPVADFVTDRPSAGW